MKRERFGGDQKEFDPSGLRGLLNQTDLNQDDNALYDVIDGLISAAETVKKSLEGKFSMEGKIDPVTQLSRSVPTNFGGVFTGTYVPVLNAIANITAPTSALFYYDKTGEFVRVFGRIQINVTLINTLSRLGISLPILSYFDFSYELVGIAVSDTVEQCAAVKADIVNKTAELSFLSTTTGNLDLYVHFAYRIVEQ